MLPCLEVALQCLAFSNINLFFSFKINETKNTNYQTHSYLTIYQNPTSLQKFRLVWVQLPNLANLTGHKDSFFLHRKGYRP